MAGPTSGPPVSCSAWLVPIPGQFLTAVPGDRGPEGLFVDGVPDISDRTVPHRDEKMARRPDAQFGQGFTCPERQIGRLRPGDGFSCHGDEDGIGRAIRISDPWNTQCSRAVEDCPGTV